MKTITLSLITIIILNVLVACKKKTETPLSNNTSSTKQQISMLVNGAQYSVTTGQSGVLKSDAHVSGSNNKLVINATKNNFDFSLYALNVLIDQDYSLKNGTGLNYAQWEDGTTVYSMVGNSKGHFNYKITKKTESSPNNFLVEGLFSGVIYSATKSDSVVITNGQIKFIQ